ncbi:hypothetical protein GQ457_01G008540 [Hibiscus cannabinus]
MEWENREMLQAEECLQYQIQNGVCGKVMTDEQVEELRKQIVAYASISEQLANLHKSMSAHLDFSGIRLGNLYWTGTPSKQKIKEIASELSQHGQISETNVYNWFQNRRARSKRKSQASTDSVNGEAEARSEGVGAKDKRTKSVVSDFSDNTGNGAESFYFQNSDSGFDQLLGKMETSRGYDLYSNLVEQFGMLG